MSFFEDATRQANSPTANTPPPSTGPLSVEHFSTMLQPVTTRVLTEVPGMTPEAGLRRTPVVIKGGMKRTVALPYNPSQQRRKVLSIIGMSLLALVLCLTGVLVTPLGKEISQNVLPFDSRLLNQDTSMNSLAAQATAVYYQSHDGYDPYAAYGQNVTNASVSRSWPPGQCTYWANLRYHQITGFWVPWDGNAAQWVTGAKLAHWGYSQTPHIPSIIVLQPGAQSAGPYGHVAVVENINPDGSVNTSNMNWGPFSTTRVEYVTFYPGPGVYFVWHP